MTNRLTQKQRILNLLSDGLPHENGELNTYAFRYASRIEELRRPKERGGDGYKIDSWRPRNRDGSLRSPGLWVYQLKATPDMKFSHTIREEAEEKRKVEERVALDSFLPDPEATTTTMIPAAYREAKDPDSLRRALPFLKQEVR